MCNRALHFLWPAPVAFRRVTSWGLIVYYVTIAAPYPGGIDPRLAVHARYRDGHYTTTRQDRLCATAPYKNLNTADTNCPSGPLPNIFDDSTGAVKRIELTSLYQCGWASNHAVAHWLIGHCSRARETSVPEPICGLDLSCVPSMIRCLEKNCWADSECALSAVATALFLTLDHVSLAVSPFFVSPLSLRPGFFFWSAPVAFQRLALETPEWTSRIRTTNAIPTEPSGRLLSLRPGLVGVCFEVLGCFVISGILAGGILGFRIVPCCFPHLLVWPFLSSFSCLSLLCILWPYWRWHTRCHLAHNRQEQGAVPLFSWFLFVFWCLFWLFLFCFVCLSLFLMGPLAGLCTGSLPAFFCGYLLPDGRAW